MQFRPRRLAATLAKAATTFPAILDTGPRQSGKTTLLRHTFKAYTYLSMERPDVRASATADPLAFFGQHRTPLIIDEILARVFSPARDERHSQHANFNLADWLLRGGYPEPRFNTDVDRQLRCSGYVQTYLQRDVRNLLNVGDLSTFTGFIQLCAARSGCHLNMTDLARDAAVSGPTVKRWLSVLEASHLIQLVRPYYQNYGKRITKSPKLYFLDTGLLTFLLGLHQREALLQGPSFGHVFETAVVAEWIKAFAHRGEPSSLYFFRSPDFEVDLVVERNQRLYGIEIKTTSTPVPRHADSLRKWLRLAGDRAQGVVACAIETPTPLAPGVRAVPWQLRPRKRTASDASTGRAPTDDRGLRVTDYPEKHPHWGDWWNSALHWLRRNSGRLAEEVRMRLILES